MSEPLNHWEKALIALSILLIVVCFGFALYDGMALSLPPYLQEMLPQEPVDAYLVNINSATADELMELPGIGEVLSARIVEFREAHGAYSCLEDLTNVPGISDEMLLDLRGLITY